MTTLQTMTIMLASIISFSVANASQLPISYPNDNRIKMVAYHNNDVVSIKGVVFTSTQITFGKGEYVLDVRGGDTAGWEVSTPDNDALANILYIKPTVLDSDSNISVVTNKHSYYFRVTSNKKVNEPQRNRTYAVKFTYPEEARAKLQAKLKLKGQKRRAVVNKKRAPQKYNWGYSFSGNKQIMPLHVFDDGTFTYFEIRHHQAVPAIFAVDDKSGDEAIVNTRTQGKYLVVQRLAPQFTLRNGKMVASVFNSKEISHIKGRG